MSSKSLEEYKKKRAFRETPEPSGRVHRSRKEPIFVVQKHDASHLHYDFRLEIDGVLKSWAVPKGPSMNPADKRLAVMTEDHPMEYANFEGVIPKGQYGGGTVMVWDKGTCEFEEPPSPREQLERGEIKVTLHGEKLRGGFVLIRTPTSKKNWLLIKRRDEYAIPDWKIDKPSLNRSALTGRTLQEIAKQEAVSI
jgi:bifunctional non-homologous end joining protein LigD